MQITELEPNAGYEKLLFCEDKSTDLQALVSIHSTKFGPAAGGCRLLNYNTLDDAKNDVQLLSKGMTYKTRVADLPLGGGKSVIIGDAVTPEKMRSFGRFINSLDGTYYTAEDVGITPGDLLYAAEESGFVAGLNDGEFASGDPSPVTAQGVFLCLKRAVEYKLGKSELQGVRVSIQGLGHVGWSVAERLHAAGAILFVSDINEENVKKAVSNLGATAVPSEAIYDVDADVFSPCALGGILNHQTVEQLNVSIIAGAANNQLAFPEIGDALKDRDVFYAPDYVVNAGGIINASMEILKRSELEFAQSRLNNLVPTLNEIIKISEDENIGMHTAADNYVEATLNDCS